MLSCTNSQPIFLRHHVTVIAELWRPTQKSEADGGSRKLEKPTAGPRPPTAAQLQPEHSRRDKRLCRAHNF
jgi:hypothetical protein